MGRLRSILGVVLATVVLLIASCGSAPTQQVTTYTPEMLQNVRIYTPAVTNLRERFPELAEAIQAEDWVEVQSFIHGPLGELRARLDRLGRTLLPQDQEAAQGLAQEVFSHLERLDDAAANRQQVIAGQEYRNALDDLDTFLGLVPEV